MNRSSQVKSCVLDQFEEHFIANLAQDFLGGDNLEVRHTRVLIRVLKRPWPVVIQKSIDVYIVEIGVYRAPCDGVSRHHDCIARFTDG